MKSIHFPALAITTIILFSCSKDKDNSSNNPPPPGSADPNSNLVVYAASENGILYAFNAADGAVVWTFTLNNSGVRTGLFSSVAFADSILYVGSSDQNIYAVNANTGKEVWHYPTNSTLGYYYSSPVVSKGVVYIPGYEQRFYALDAKTGQLKWSHDFPRDFMGSPVVYDNTVFVGSLDGRLFALNTTDGLVKWVIGGAGATWGVDYGVSSPCIKDGVIYSVANVIGLSGTTGILNELSANDGTAYHGGLANFPIDSQFAFMSSPVIDDSIVYIGGLNKKLYAVKNGDSMFYNKQWSFTAGNMIYSTPAYNDSAVFFADLSGTFYAINKFTGILNWTFDTYGFVTSSPVVANNVVYYGGSNGFYALNAKTGKLIWRTPQEIAFSSSPCLITKQGKVYHGGISGMAN